MRLFIAINFEKPVIDKIIDVQNQLRNQAVRGNFTKEENLHLTLIFLGEIEEGKINLIQRGMNEITSPSFDLVFNSTGCFKRDGRDIWWIGLENNPLLLNLQKNLSINLQKLGFHMEKRSFKPHLTLGREVNLKEKLMIEFLDFHSTVREICLMKSERVNGKLTYTSIFSKKL